jgi:hypothetical protein
MGHMYEAHNFLAYITKIIKTASQMQPGIAHELMKDLSKLESISFKSWLSEKLMEIIRR